MKQLFLGVAALIFGTTLVCDGQFLYPEPTRAMPMPGSPDDPSPNYDVRGVFDPGLNGMIVLALKAPRGWQMQQAFTRQWIGAAPNNYIYVGLVSPDGHDSIEYLPEMDYHYSDGPAERGTQQWMAQHGQHDPTRLSPLLPLDYLKRVFLPLLAQKAGLQVRVTGENATAPVAVGPGMESASGYIEGVLPSGRQMRIETKIGVLTGNITGNPMHNWGANTKVIQSDRDLAACLARADVVNRSIVFNPAWQAQNQQLQQRGAQLNHQQTMDNLAASQRRFEQNVRQQQQQRAAINRNYENHRRASDQVSSAFADYIGDRVMYENPNTGERVKMQSGSSHVYQDAQGTTLSTNAPLDSNHVDWQELQQVEVKNY